MDDRIILSKDKKIYVIDNSGNNKSEYELNLNKDEVILNAKSKKIEDKYLSNTNSARNNKIFGSPSFIVNNEIFVNFSRF